MLWTRRLDLLTLFTGASAPASHARKSQLLKGLLQARRGCGPSAFRALAGTQIRPPAIALAHWLSKANGSLRAGQHGLKWNSISHCARAAAANSNVACVPRRKTSASKRATLRHRQAPAREIELSLHPSLSGPGRTPVPHPWAEVPSRGCHVHSRKLTQARVRPQPSCRLLRLEGSKRTWHLPLKPGCNEGQNLFSDGTHNSSEWTNMQGS